MLTWQRTHGERCVHNASELTVPLAAAVGRLRRAEIQCAELGARCAGRSMRCGRSTAIGGSI
jgi:hypothetical protein